MPTRNDYLKWAKEADPELGHLFATWDNAIEALCSRVWNEAIKAAAEVAGCCSANCCGKQDVLALKQGDLK